MTRRPSNRDLMEMQGGATTQFVHPILMIDLSQWRRQGSLGTNGIQCMVIDANKWHCYVLTIRTIIDSLHFRLAGLFAGPKLRQAELGKGRSVKLHKVPIARLDRYAAGLIWYFSWMVVVDGRCRVYITFISCISNNYSGNKPYFK